MSWTFPIDLTFDGQVITLPNGVKMRVFEVNAPSNPAGVSPAVNINIYKNGDGSGPSIRVLLHSMAETPDKVDITAVLRTLFGGEHVREQWGQGIRVTHPAATVWMVAVLVALAADPEGVWAAPLGPEDAIPPLPNGFTVRVSSGPSMAMLERVRVEMFRGGGTLVSQPPPASAQPDVMVRLHQDDTDPDGLELAACCEVVLMSQRSRREAGDVQTHLMRRFGEDAVTQTTRHHFVIRGPKEKIWITWVLMVLAEVCHT